MKAIGNPQQKPKLNVAILLRSPLSSPTVRFPPTMARYLHIQSVHAGNAVEAPMMSLAAVVVNGVRRKTCRFRNKALTNITPYRCFVPNVVRPNKTIHSVGDVQDEEPHDQREGWDVSGPPMPAGGNQNEESGEEGTSR